MLGPFALQVTLRTPSNFPFAWAAGQPGGEPQVFIEPEPDGTKALFTNLEAADIERTLKAAWYAADAEARGLAGL